MKKTIIWALLILVVLAGVAAVGYVSVRSDVGYIIDMTTPPEGFEWRNSKFAGAGSLDWILNMTVPSEGFKWDESN